ncbi:hypothetical protein ACFL27_23175 [candidate division CSSED10-310 bacterium]|uniref:NACHT domain-containing protein n=1 Tax=candidate division CSSED10-310 bacterium TaxID=2855610 RepID=A0ABV6Z3T9_UNCC1
MILLDPKYHADQEKIDLDQKLLHSLPKPLQAFTTKLEDDTHHQLKLQELCLSLIPLTFQYIALILSCEYFNTKLPPKTEVTDSLMRMIKRPGAGKWVGFIRSATSYFKEHGCQVITPDALAMLHTTLVARRKPKITMVEPSGLKNKVDYYEALINIRNRFAHSRQISESSAAQLFSDYYRIWKALISLLHPFFTVRILRLVSTEDKYIPYDNAAFDPPQITPRETGEVPLIIINKQKVFLELKPLLVLLTMPEESQDDVLFLEEMKGKKLLYLYKDHYIKRKEEYGSFIALIDSRTVPMTAVSSSELSVPILSQRIHRITQTALTDFEDTLKYIPSMFVERPSIGRRLDEWLKAQQPGTIVVGEPGTGKTSLVANWCGQRIEQGDHVLLLEAAKLEHSDLPRTMEDLLHLGSPLRECLESIYQQNRNVPADTPPVRFIVIIDGVNEFVGSGLDNRSLLWQEISNLVNRFDDYRPFFKCLATTRSDLWIRDFPKKDSLDLRFKRRLFYGSDTLAFPLIQVGQLTDEEAAAIYEKARTGIAGMAPRTPWQELAPTTRTVVRNPFLLRLLLRTYNDLDVPALNERTLTRHYAQEQALNDREKKEILFRLLDRMAELRKTEISLTEFLQTKKDKKRKVKMKIRDLDGIVYDPRSQSPYKQLLGEGLIEERSVSANGETEERLAFAQEKITTLLDREHKVEQLKRSLRRFLYFFLVIFILYGLIFMLESHQTARMVRSFPLIFTDCTLPAADIGGLLKQAIAITNMHNRHFLMFISLTLFPISLFYLLTINSIFLRRLSSIHLAQDLPSQYTNRKFAKVRDRHLGVVMGICFILYFLIFRSPHWHNISLIAIINDIMLVIIKNPHLFRDLLVFLTLTFIAANVYTILRHGSVPEDATTLLGKRAALESGLSLFLIFVPLLLLLFLWVNVLAYVNSEQGDAIAAMEKEFLSGPAYQSLEKSPERKDKAVLMYMKFSILDTWRTKRIIRDDAIPFFKRACNGFTASIFMILPLFLGLQWLAAIPVEAWLRQRRA